MGVRLDDSLERRRRYLAALDRVTARERTAMDRANQDDRDPGERWVQVDREALVDLIAAGNRLGRLLDLAWRPGTGPSLDDVERSLSWWDRAHDQLGDDR